MLLWNWVIPSVTGWAVLNYWQALCMLLLAKILFSNPRGSHHCGPCGPRSRMHHSPETREALMKFRKKMASMSEEEREAFIKEKLASLSDNE